MNKQVLIEHETESLRISGMALLLLGIAMIFLAADWCMYLASAVEPLRL